MTLLKSGQAASDVMKALRDSGATTVPHTSAPIHLHCLMTVQDSWGVPAGHYAASAIDAWNSTPTKYRHNDPNAAPIGAPHFWAVGQYGHVTMQSDRPGLVWSTDVPIDNHVGLMALSWFGQHWGAHYLGWTSWLEGYELPVSSMPYLPTPKSPSVPTVHAPVPPATTGSTATTVTAKPRPFPLKPGHIFAFKGKHHGLALLGRVHDGTNSLDRIWVRTIQQRLQPNVKPSGIYDAATEAHVLAWQKAHQNIRNGVRPIGAVDAPTWKALGL